MGEYKPWIKSMLNTYLQVAFNNPRRVISHWLLTRTRSFLGPSKIAAAEIFFGFIS